MSADPKHDPPVELELEDIAQQILAQLYLFHNKMNNLNEK